MVFAIVIRSRVKNGKSQIQESRINGRDKYLWLVNRAFICFLTFRLAYLFYLPTFFKMKFVNTFINSWDGSLVEENSSEFLVILDKLVFRNFMFNSAFLAFAKNKEFESRFDRGIKNYRKNSCVSTHVKLM